MTPDPTFEELAKALVERDQGAPTRLARAAFDAIESPLFWLRASDAELIFGNAAFHRLGPRGLALLREVASRHSEDAAEDSVSTGSLPHTTRVVEIEGETFVCAEVHTLRKEGFQEPLARRITDLGPNLVSIFDLEKQTTAFANARWQELHGLTEKEMTEAGLTILTDRIHPDDLGLFYSVAQQLGEAEEGAVVESEYRIRDAQGSWRRIHTWDSVFGLGPQGDIRSVLSTALDVSEQREREAEIRESERHLRQVQKLESLGVLAGGIAHDFNNLLTGILGYADLLSRALPEHSESADFSREIGLLAERASQLCERILTYGGRPLEHPAELDISAIVRESVSLARASLPRGARLVLDLAMEKYPVLGNEVEVLQLAMNAIINAAEALNEGSGSVYVSLRPVEVDERRIADHLGGQGARPGSYAELEVRDEGRGMNRETLDRMFDPFFTTKGQGRGLGLSAVLGIIRGHGGVLEIDSTEGQGTTFRALFPRLSDEVRAADSVGTPNRFEKLHARVLVVDDEESVREVASRILAIAGCTVSVAATGQGGLAAYAADPSFDAVLVDIVLPDVGGLQVAQALRDAGCDAAIILTSGFAGEDPLPADFPHFLPKPFGEVSLRRSIAEALAASGRLAPVQSLSPAPQRD